MISEFRLSSIKAMGKIESVKHELKQMEETLNSLTLWRPAKALERQCRQVIGMVQGLEERFDRKLTITLVGPSGSGKSTLLNALAGVDHLSETGHQRPTTRKLVVLTQNQQHAEQLQREIGSEKISFITSPESASLEHIILIDTPDTDSTEQEHHIFMVKKAIGLSDILICLFDSANPKRKDYVDFLAPYLRLFNGDALIVALNKCDRQKEQDLKENIIPDFQNYLQKAWEIPVHSILCICARNHLKNPGWDPMAVPLCGFDQFDYLKNIIFGTLNRASYVIDRRLENALTLRDYLINEIRSEAQKDAKRLMDAMDQLAELEKQAVKETLIFIGSETSGRNLGIQALLYQNLAQKWLGPMGWMIAVWARILINNTFLAAVFRFGTPIKQIWEMVSSLMHFKISQTGINEVAGDRRAESYSGLTRISVQKQWPHIAETMIKGRFDHSVRNPDTTGKDHEVLKKTLSSLWSDALDVSILRTADRLSGFYLQLIFNLPSLGILSHGGYLTLTRYFAGDYFSLDFFIHGCATLLILIFLSFFSLQVLIRMFGGIDQITDRTFQLMSFQLESWSQVPSDPVAKQIRTVVALASLAGKKSSEPSDH